MKIARPTDKILLQYSLGFMEINFFRFIYVQKLGIPEYLSRSFMELFSGVHPSTNRTRNKCVST